VAGNDVGHQYVHRAFRLIRRARRVDALLNHAPNVPDDQGQCVEPFCAGQAGADQCA
jgi:hypothetical protein